jgi:hypothetical protein
MTRSRFASATSEDEAMDALARSLEELRFRLPPIDSVWTPEQARSDRRTSPWRALVLAAALMLTGAGIVLAAESLFPVIMGTPGVADCTPERCGADYQVTAQISNAPDGVVGYDVVVSDGVDRARLAEISRILAGSSRGSRVIVWLFSEQSGPERHQFPLLPTATDSTSAPAPTRQDAWLATFDFAPSGGEPAVQARS